MDIPFLSGFNAQTQQNQQQSAQQLAQAGGLMQVLGQLRAQAEKEKAAQRQEQFRSAIVALGPNPTQEQLAGVSGQFVDDPAKLLAVQQGSLDRAAAREAAATTAAATREQTAATATANREAMLERQRERIDANIEAARQRGVDAENLRRMTIAGQESLARLAAQLRPAPQPQALIPIVGEDGNPVLATRENAEGKTPWAVGSKIEAKNEGKKQLKDTVDRLAASYDNLEKQGAVVSPEKNVVSNVWERAAASGIGQTVAGFAGTKAQRERDSIASARASLMAALKSATGLSAQQLNSNAELQFYMQMATDPTKSIEANRDALAYFDKTYGLGLGLSGDPVRIAPPRQSAAGTIGAPRQERRSNTVKFGDLK